ncbi:MAG TPA: efflux RND transporter periplasmic adaptor subunit [Longimicrobiales bacterium]
MTNTEQESVARRLLRKRAVVVAGLVVAVGAVAGAIAVVNNGKPAGTAGAAPSAMPPMPVDVASAQSQTVVSTVRATGRIEAVQAVELRSDQQGRITKLLFHEGQSVTVGAPLIAIDDALLRAQAERGQAERDLAHQQLERVRKLRADNAASPADLERAEAAERSAAAALAVLQLQIERSTVRAPFTGVIGQRFVSTGDYVTTSTPLLTLQTIDPQRAVIEVPERYAGQLQPGQNIEFTIAAQPDHVFNAQVDFIDAVVQDASRTIVVKARAANPKRVLKPGMFIEARLATEKRSNAVVVPEDAVQPMRTTNVVWAVVDGKASRREVQLGARSRGVVEVLSGLHAGDVVVVGGLERMGEGMAVAPRPQQANAPATSPSKTE